MVDFDFFLALPVIVLASYGILAMLLAPWMRGSSRALGGVALIGLMMTGWSLFRLWRLIEVTGPQETAFGLVRIDPFGLFFSFIVVIVGFLSVLVSMSFLEREEADHGEFYPL
jgi:NADH-quinone oxidoreductase subunit N